ncbi:hypothetical protein COBT_003562, partial [Conglomerata obtusa]
GENMIEKIDRAVSSYNNTYHSFIKCTPKQAILDHSNYRIFENNNENLNNKRKNKKNEKNIKEENDYVIGDKVRIFQHDNVTKEMRSRFLKTGTNT